MTDSILTGTKKILGLDADYTAFDFDVLTHINSVFATLNQLGVGPDTTFMITGTTENWDDFIGPNNFLNSVKSYMYLKVRLAFDPPATSFTQDSMTKIAAEYEWRLMIAAESQVTVSTPGQLDAIQAEVTAVQNDVEEIEDEIDNLPDLQLNFENHLI